MSPRLRLSIFEGPSLHLLPVTSSRLVPRLGAARNAVVEEGRKVAGIDARVSKERLDPGVAVHRVVGVRDAVERPLAMSSPSLPVVSSRKALSALYLVGVNYVVVLLLDVVG
mmetsp:Transcript_57037/g.144631  ORF Transcript_57037/g.144631 Transcript_57037/m.144631 type:complete len:112 (+) Transcript_57037:394-729(+)